MTDRPLALLVELPPGVSTDRISRVLPQIDTAAGSPHRAIADMAPLDLAVVLETAARAFRAARAAMAHNGPDSLPNPSTREGG